MHILISRDGPSRVYIHTDFMLSQYDKVRTINPRSINEISNTAEDLPGVLSFYFKLQNIGIASTTISPYQLGITRYLAFDFVDILHNVISALISAYELDVADLEIGEGVGWGDDTFKDVSDEYLIFENLELTDEDFD